MLRLGHIVNRHLVRSPGALNRQSVDLLGSGPALRRTQHDHRPPRTIRFPVLAGLTLDLFDLVEHQVEQRGHPLMHIHRIVARDDVGRIAVAFQQLAELGFRDPRQNGWIGDFVAIEVQDR